MFSMAGEELTSAEGVGESDTYTDRAGGVSTSGFIKLENWFQFPTWATLGHSFSTSSTSDSSPLTTNRHFLMVPFWDVLNFLLTMMSLSPRGADVICLMAFIIRGCSLRVTTPDIYYWELATFGGMEFNVFAGYDHHI